MTPASSSKAMATTHPTSTRPTTVRPRRRALAPLEPVRAQSRWVLGIGFFILFFAVWAFFTLGGYVSPTFLASPVTMVQEAVLLFTEFNFAHDIAMTIWRVLADSVSAFCAMAKVPLLKVIA